MFRKGALFLYEDDAASGFHGHVRVDALYAGVVSEYLPVIIEEPACRDRYQMLSLKRFLHLVVQDPGYLGGLAGDHDIVTFLHHLYGVAAGDEANPFGSLLQLVLVRGVAVSVPFQYGSRFDGGFRQGGTHISHSDKSSFHTLTSLLSEKERFGTEDGRFFRRLADARLHGENPAVRT